MIFDQAAPTAVPQEGSDMRSRRAVCAHCGERIFVRVTFDEQPEWPHVDPYDALHPTLCQVGYPNVVATPREDAHAR